MSLSNAFEGYSTRDLVALFEVSRNQIYRWIKIGGLAPEQDRRGRLRFDFHDLVLLRAVRMLVDSGLTAQRIQKALARVRDELPEGRPLSSVVIGVEHGRVVVREDGRSWDAATGQQRLDFEVAELAAKVAPLARRAVEAAREREAELDADSWFNLGFELEAASPEEAEAAYRRAIELDGSHSGAHLNFGRLRHEQGDLESAEEHYRRATRAASSLGMAWFNLGVVLEDRDRSEEAVVAYERALEEDPWLLDAHYNLAGLAEARGDQVGAIRHLKAYRSLRDGGGN